MIYIIFSKRLPTQIMLRRKTFCTCEVAKKHPLLIFIKIRFQSAKNKKIKIRGFDKIAKGEIEGRMVLEMRIDRRLDKNHLAQ